jgi:hypothetical protein
MGLRRVLLIPGSTSPILSPKYQVVYDDLHDASKERGFDAHLVVFPGQWADDGMELTFEGSLNTTVNACLEFRPHWVIARSFGCLVAMAAAAIDAVWMRECRGIVLWGPSTSRYVQNRWGTPEKEAATILAYADHGTRIARGFFTTMPSMDDCIRAARCSLRIARGDQDEYSTWTDMEELCGLHTAAQPEFRCETRAVLGLGHHVVRSETSPAKWAEYCDALFHPMPSKRLTRPIGETVPLSRRSSGRSA